MIICSNFVCSKNLLDTILLLLDSVRAIIIFRVNCSNPVNLWESTGFEQFHFQSKKYQLLELQMVDKDVENVNCSTQFIVKKMVYMYGSQVRGQVRGQVRLGQVYMYGSQVRCQVRLGQVRLGQVRLGQVRLGIRLGRVVLVSNKYGR